MGPWRVYVIFKIAKGFLYRGVYTVGRGSVYAIFEEEKGKFEKSIYERRTEIRHLGAWQVYAILEKGQGIFQKAYTREGLESGILGSCSFVPSIRYFQDSEGLSI